MKIRTGFISNSSSSSFLILGTDFKDIITKLVEYDKIMEYSNDCITKHDGLIYIGENGKYFYSPTTGKRVSVCPGIEEGFINPNIVGIEVEKRLETKTIAELRQEFKENVKKKINIDLPDKIIKLHYGEVSTDDY